MRRWFWFGLLTSVGFLLSDLLLRMALLPAAAAALASLIGTSLALLLVWLFTPAAATAQPPRRPLTRADPTPIPIGLGLAGTGEWAPPPRQPAAAATRSVESAAVQVAPLANRPQPTTPPSLDQPSAAPANDLLQELTPLGFHGAVEEFKRRLLGQAIACCAGNRAEAARRLGLQRTYLYRLTKQLACGEPARQDGEPVEDQSEAR